MLLHFHLLISYPNICVSDLPLPEPKNKLNAERDSELIQQLPDKAAVPSHQDNRRASVGVPFSDVSFKSLDFASPFPTGSMPSKLRSDSNLHSSEKSDKASKVTGIKRTASLAQCPFTGMFSFEPLPLESDTIDSSPEETAAKADTEIDELEIGKIQPKSVCPFSGLFSFEPLSSDSRQANKHTKSLPFTNTTNSIMTTKNLMHNSVFKPSTKNCVSTSKSCQVNFSNPEQSKHISETSTRDRLKHASTQTDTNIVTCPKCRQADTSTGEKVLENGWHLEENRDSSKMNIMRPVPSQVTEALETTNIMHPLSQSRVIQKCQETMNKLPQVEC